MQYGITMFTAGPRPFARISRADFEKTHRAKWSLVALVAIEESFDFLMEDYAEYEQDLLEIALATMVSASAGERAGREDIQRVNRRVMNLLSAARSYVDQTAHQLSGLKEMAPDAPGAFKKARNEQHSNSLGYQVMEQLRDYAQHRNFPVHSFGRLSSMQPVVGGTSQLVFRSVPELDINELGEDPRFDKGVLAQLRREGKTVPLTPMVRQYIEGLGAVHEALRRHFRELTRDWGSCLEMFLQRGAEAFGEQASTFALAKREGKKIVSIEYVLVYPAEYVHWLQSKNSLPNRLSIKYVSGAAP